MAQLLRLAAVASCWNFVATGTMPRGEALRTERVVYVEAQHTAAVAAVRDGTAVAPFATIDEARDHVRALRSALAGGAGERHYRILVGPGTYAPLHLDARDSGSASAPLVIEANRANRAPAVISGGIQIPKTSFQRWTGGHPGIVKADLSPLGVVDYGSLTAGGDCGGDCSGFAKAGLVFSNVSMVLSRWPNVDNTTGRYVWEKIQIGGANGFSVKDPAVVPRMAKWAAEEEPLLHSYATVDWSDSWDYANISASADEVIVTIADPKPPPPATSYGSVGRYDYHAVAAPPMVWLIKITAPPGAWSRPTLLCNGTAASRFRVTKVPAGSPQDPTNGTCKRYHTTQNILQISEDNGTTWRIAPSNSTSGFPGALACGNADQFIGSASFGPLCPAVLNAGTCKASAPRCTWTTNGSCAWAPPAPPAPPGHFFKVGQAKFYGANLLCELDAPNEVSGHAPVSDLT